MHECGSSRLIWEEIAEPLTLREGGQEREAAGNENSAAKSEKTN
jgi:hypothetical protein